MSLFDLKVIHSVLDQLEEERGIPKERVIEAIEAALATAYKKEYGKRGQIIRAAFNPEDGSVRFEQVKIVVDDSMVYEFDPENEEERAEDDERERYIPERHIYIEDARRIKKDVELGDEMSFPLEDKEDYGRISAQTAKQVIIQKIREAEKVSVTHEYGDKQGEIVSGTVQRIERGNIFVDLGRATGIIPWEEQIRGERFKPGDRIRAYLYNVEETQRGVYLRLSRSRPEFLKELFALEAPEVANGVVEIKAIAREAGSRSKVAVWSNDEYIDPVGSLVGQRGVRVSTVMSELGGEKIDIIEWSENPTIFVEEALSPAQVLAVHLDETSRTATVDVAPDQQSLAIGKGGQNARLAAKLTGYKIDIQSVGGAEEQEKAFDEVEEQNEAEEIAEEALTDTPVTPDDDAEENFSDDVEEADNELEAEQEVEEVAEINELEDETEEAATDNS